PCCSTPSSAQFRRVFLTVSASRARAIPHRLERVLSVILGGERTFLKNYMIDTKNFLYKR
ncbi:MAG TPA: hypothetical protein DER33_05155, partial [Syntrophomonas sp.]|nr:hypothetical protein [Syntrophomonas sp.]